MTYIVMGGIVVFIILTGLVFYFNEKSQKAKMEEHLKEGKLKMKKAILKIEVSSYDFSKEANTVRDKLIKWEESKKVMKLINNKG